MAEPFSVTPTSDYTAATFEGAALNLFELWRAHFPKTGMLLRGLRFRRCVIEGPAVLLPVSGCRFDACDFGDAKDDMRNLLLRPLSPSRVTGAIPMQDCAFEDCRFFAIGFTGSPDFLDEMTKIEPGGDPT